MQPIYLTWEATRGVNIRIGGMQKNHKGRDSNPKRGTVKKQGEEEKQTQKKHLRIIDCFF